MSDASGQALAVSAIQGGSSRFVDGADIFSGLRVVDLTHVLAGPYCTRLLADLGAEVMKVERPGIGDESRYLPHVLGPGHSGYFLQYNCGKRSIALDFKEPDQLEILRRLIASSDVVVESFRPGALAKAGLGYEALRELNPRLVMCSISAYGQTGPRALDPGHGLMAEALGGVLDMNGDPDGPPMPPGIAAADIAAGVFAFGAIAAALYRRARTGEGDYIDIALLDCAIQFHEIALQEHLFTAGSITRHRAGTEHPSVVPYGAYRARDGYITIAAASDHVWRRLTEAMGTPDLAEQYPTNEDRLAHRSDVSRHITDWLATMPSRSDAAALLRAAGVPHALVNAIPDVVADSQLRYRGMFVTHHDELAGDVELVRSPLRFKYARSGLRGRAPRLGADTESILVELGHRPPVPR